MNLAKMAQGITAITGGMQKIGTMVQTGAGKVAAGAQAIQTGAQKTVATVDSAADLVNTTTATFDKAIGAVKGVATIQEKSDELVSEVQQTLVQSVAKRQVSQATRVTFQGGVMFQREKMLAEQIDPKFAAVIEESGLKRVGTTFLPTKMPSGVEVPLGKAQTNEILFNQSHKKPTRLTVTKDGDTFILNAMGKPTKRHHELANLASVERLTGSGESEKITTCYYPESCEVHSLSKAIDGSKTGVRLNGNEEGGTIFRK